MKPNENKWQRSPTAPTLLNWSVLLLLLALAVAVATGCKQQVKSATGINPAGTYMLVSVDGKAVPCTVQHDGHTLTVKAGTFIINSDGTCSSKMAFVPPTGREASREVKATYQQQGDKLTMRWEGAGMTAGTVHGDTFTMNNEGMMLAYRK